MKKFNFKFKGIIIGLIIILIIFLLPFSIGKTARLIVSSCLMLFLPGLLFTLIVFPKASKLTKQIDSGFNAGGKLDIIERIMLSPFFSIMIFIITFKIFQYIGTPLNSLKIMLILVAIIIIEGVIVFINIWKKRLDIKKIFKC